MRALVLLFVAVPLLTLGPVCVALSSDRGAITDPWSFGFGVAALLAGVLACAWLVRGHRDPR